MICKNREYQELKIIHTGNWIIVGWSSKELHVFHDFSIQVAMLRIVQSTIRHIGFFLFRILLQPPSVNRV